MRTSTLLFAAILFPAALAAQDQAEAAAQGSALVIRTADPSVADKILQGFDSEAKLPEIGEGTVAVLTLDDGGMLNVSTAQGNGYLHIEARPAQLMQIFAPQIAQTRMQAQAMGGMMLGQSGFDGKDATDMVAGVFGFPNMIDRLTVEMAEGWDPNHQINLDIAIDPVAGTWLGKFVDALRANEKGLPKLAGDKALITVDASCDMARLGESLRPIMALAAKRGQKDKDAQAAAAEYMDTMIKALDGTMSMAFDPSGNGMRLLAGLRESEPLATLLRDAGYNELQKAAIETSGMAEATIEPAAFEHRGVVVSRTTTAMDNPQMSPFGGDGDMVNLAAVTGDCLVSMGYGSGEGEMKAAIDDVLDHKIKRVQLPSAALLAVSLRLAEVMSFMSERSGGMMQVDEDLPETVGLSVNKTGESLTITVRSK